MSAILETQPTAKERLYQGILHHIKYSLGMTPGQLTSREAYSAAALAVRDQVIDHMLDTEQRYQQAHAKRLYYLSMEFLPGQSLANNLMNLGLQDACAEALQDLGFGLDELFDYEADAALGNGGLGRLAACFLDSLATLGLPGFGYGINYEYGLFRQEIKNGEQFEKPDNWRTHDSPWELARPQDAILVPLYGRVEDSQDRLGNYNPMWLDWKVVIGVPHDIPIVGYHKPGSPPTVNYLRLYSARASREVDMSIFNEGDYLRAVEQKVTSETLSKVLYPSETAAAGRELRLTQEYFLVACAVRDIVRRFTGIYNGTPIDFRSFPDKVAIQLNDTHPALTVVELMRVLVDENSMNWDQAWEITQATCGYTNHTLMPEALERWPVSLLGKVLPRHLQIIYEINHRFLKEVAQRHPGDGELLQRVSLVEEGEPRMLRMANLSIIGSHSINGVAAVHSRLVQTELVPDFARLYPERFNNKTNGMTPRRWLKLANPALAQLVTDVVGEEWVTDLEKLRGLEPLATDRSFQEKFQAAKRENKERLAQVIAETVGEDVDCDSLFDVHIKRIHEYKRQLLNVLHIVHEYLALVDEGIQPRHPRTFVFAGKAAPGYYAAKQIIRLIHDVAKVINRDSRAREYFRVAFVPDYRVSLAQVIIPAADLSEQVSTAGTEASGTGNMKFALNGALTIGTLDGANIEIREEVGEDNIFIFGLTVEQIRQQRASGPYQPWEIYQRSHVVRRILDAFKNNRFCQRTPGQHNWVYDRLLGQGEKYYHLADLESYLHAHDAAAQLYCDRFAWTTKAIYNVARVGKFSSDRTIAEYAREIWGMM